LKHLYFIQDQSSKDIKIGRTNDINRRLKEIKIGSNRSYDLLYAFNNLGHLEKEMHQTLSKYRIQYEWFSKDCLEDALSFLKEHGVEEDGFDQTWGKVCDFDRWVKDTDLQLYEDISYFVLISIAFGFIWSKSDLEYTFKMTRLDVDSLIVDIQSKDQIHILGRFFSMLIDEEKLELTKYNFTDIENIDIQTGFYTYASQSLIMCETIRRELNQIKIELRHMVINKMNSSKQVCLFG